MSEIVRAAELMKEFMPILSLLMVFGVAVSVAWKFAEGDGGLSVGNITMLMVMILGLLVVSPILGKLLGIGSDGEPLTEETLNFTVMSKGIEYERGFFGARKKFVLILSDGEKYKVPRDVYDLYDTGDPVTITISANRKELTFR